MTGLATLVTSGQRAVLNQGVPVPGKRDTLKLSEQTSAQLMLTVARASTIIQEATTGDVNWGEVALSGVLGGLGSQILSGLRHWLVGDFVLRCSPVKVIP